MNVITVIASEAKQSILSLLGAMDCVVASAPRNDGLLHQPTSASTAFLNA
ncbi:hypothetical protein SAMN05444050_3666 [Afipia sp. GAS231]|nr:hypothetical protein SAMN05444050_3666 [Afipia sp. GAS231]